jgi:flagellar biosynthetic protein FlhB
MPFHTEDRTEAPTPRRRQEARAKGQVARSQDLTAAAILFAAILALRFFGLDVFNGLLAIVSSGLILESPNDIPDLRSYVQSVGKTLADGLGPFLLAVLASGLTVLFIQVGPLLTFQPITPSLSRVNPLKGIQRLFSLRSFVTSLVQLVKFGVVSLVAFVSLQFEAARILFSSTVPLGEMAQLGAALVAELCLELSGAVLVTALLDFAWQRYRHERDLMMTREEVRDELRNMEGDPAVKRRRRQLQMQLAMHRLRKDVPKSDVVVTNPTHFAVAIQYNADSMIAPRVVAKGADYAALRIRQIALRHGIPIVERKPLARALFDAVEVGQYIPERFYRAIAEILAYVYELTGRSPVAGRQQLVRG